MQRTPFSYVPPDQDVENVVASLDFTMDQIIHGYKLCNSLGDSTFLI